MKNRGSFHIGWNYTRECCDKMTDYNDNPPSNEAGVKERGNDKVNVNLLLWQIQILERGMEVLWVLLFCCFKPHLIFNKGTGNCY